MSVTNQTDKIYGSGNGVTTVFSFPFKIFDVTQIVAYLINVATGAVTGPLIITTNYSVAINPSTDGGTVTFVVAPPTGYTWFLKRTVPYTQAAVIPTEGTFPGKQFENQLDLMTMMVIQDQEAITRCLQLPVTYTGTLPVTIPNGLANAAIGWDPTGTFLTNVLVTAVGTLPVPVPNSYLVALTAGSLVSGAALFNLASIPSGAGIIPIANIPSIPNTSLTAGVGTSAGNLIALNGSAQIPALDASLLTKLPVFTSQNVVTGSRAFGTVYRNTTGKTMFVTIAMGNPTQSDIAINSDSNSSPSTKVAETNNPGSSGVSAVSFMVLNNNYYEAISSSSVVCWTEWS